MKGPDYDNGVERDAHRKQLDLVPGKRKAKVDRIASRRHGES